MTTAPDGGFDVARQPKTPTEFWYDELVNTDNPLEVYMGMQQPLSYDEHEPLRLGAGAYATPSRNGVLSARDGDGLYVVWEELGPMTERDEDGRRKTVQGLYWAVLEGCEPTAR